MEEHRRFSFFFSRVVVHLAWSGVCVFVGVVWITLDRVILLDVTVDVDHVGNRDLVIE